MSRKVTYQSPRIEVIALHNEGVMAASAGLDGMDGTDFISNSAGAQSGSITSSGNAAAKGANSMQDLEDMLNDLFTTTK
ncbi:hypothetical protein D0T50_10470 [Bacteroides sp. 214]|uniref:hypothetical protein n=1 Tax=Bacteroides sp. 214 TaxID=2302935 RepID=UPI0013D61328|nr:hypothetical protein [Bacteroides sp. 214]NDW13314.1 hypothetical protein [Bacteroides sp. 214]